MRALQQSREAFKYLAIVGICVLAFSIRLFSVIKYESVIHEFDPYFNYRVTQFLTKEGFYDLCEWPGAKWAPLAEKLSRPCDTDAVLLPFLRRELVR